MLNMGIKDFFKKVGGKIKDGLKAGYSFVKEKVVPVAGRIARAGLNILQNLPGKIGAIGKIGGAVIDTVKNVAGQIPNDKIRDKVVGTADKVGERVSHVVETGQTIANRANGIANDAVQRAGAAYNAVKAGVGAVKQAMGGS